MPITPPPSYNIATNAVQQQQQQTTKPTVAIQPRDPPSQQQQQTVYAIAQPNLGGVNPQRRPPTHMQCSILTCIFCCWPCGVVAIVRSAETSMALKCGNWRLAFKYSKKAKFWIYASVIVGIIFYVLYGYYYYNNYN